MQFNRSGNHTSLLKSKKLKKPLPAAEIAALALQHMADDPKLLSRFMDLTGIAPNDLREASRQPEFLVAVLDFFLGYEPNLLEFAATNELAPESIGEARAFLLSNGAQYD